MKIKFKKIFENAMVDSNIDDNISITSSSDTKVDDEQSNNSKSSIDDKELIDDTGIVDATDFDDTQLEKFEKDYDVSKIYRNYGVAQIISDISESASISALIDLIEYKNNYNTITEAYSDDEFLMSDKHHQLTENAVPNAIDKFKKSLADISKTKFPKIINYYVQNKSEIDNKYGEFKDVYAIASKLNDGSAEVSANIVKSVNEDLIKRTTNFSSISKIVNLFIDDTKSIKDMQAAILNYTNSKIKKSDIAATAINEYFGKNYSSSSVGNVSLMSAAINSEKETITTGNIINCKITSDKIYNLISKINGEELLSNFIKFINECIQDLNKTNDSVELSIKYTYYRYKFNVYSTVISSIQKSIDSIIAISLAGILDNTVALKKLIKKSKSNKSQNESISFGTLQEGLGIKITAGISGAIILYALINKLISSIKLKNKGKKMEEIYSYTRNELYKIIDKIKFVEYDKSVIPCMNEIIKLYKEYENKIYKLDIEFEKLNSYDEFLKNKDYFKSEYSKVCDDLKTKYSDIVMKYNKSPEFTENNISIIENVKKFIDMIFDGSYWRNCDEDDFGDRYNLTWFNSNWDTIESVDKSEYNKKVMDVFNTYKIPGYTANDIFDKVIKCDFPLKMIKIQLH